MVVLVSTLTYIKLLRVYSLTCIPLLCAPRDLSAKNTLSSVQSLSRLGNSRRLPIQKYVRLLPYLRRSCTAPHDCSDLKRQHPHWCIRNLAVVELFCLILWELRTTRKLIGVFFYKAKVRNFRAHHAHRHEKPYNQRRKHTLNCWII